MITSWTTALFEDHGDKLSDPEAQQMKYFIVDGAERMRTLIKDLLRFSQAGRGLRPQETSPMLAISSAVRALAQSIHEASGRFEYANIPNTVWADPAMLAQVFQNVFSNCIKFRRKDVPLEVKVCAYVVGSTAKFQVTDNGLGIDPKYLTKVFEVFTRLYSTSEFPGTGIGLALARRVIHAHGGEIGILSDGPGHGTTVWFTVPITKEDRGDAP